MCCFAIQLRRFHDLAALTSAPPIELCWTQSFTTTRGARIEPNQAKVEPGPRSFQRPSRKNSLAHSNTHSQNSRPVLKMRRPATLILATAAACATMSSNTADAMALVPRRATPKPTGTSTKPSADNSSAPSVPSTALFARPSPISGNPQPMTSSAAAAAAAPTKIDTSSFGRDADDIDSYRSQMLDLVYHRSMHRAGLE